MARADRCDLFSLAASVTTSRKPQRCWPGYKPKYVLAGKGYDSRELVALIQSLGAQTVIPPRSCQQPRAYDKARYRLRNRIERCFARLKQLRRIATRFDRKSPHFLAFLYLASIPLWAG